MKVSDKELGNLQFQAERRDERKRERCQQTKKNAVEAVRARPALDYTEKNSPNEVNVLRERRTDFNVTNTKQDNSE